jgi:hypothetical protein
MWRGGHQKPMTIKDEIKRLQRLEAKIVLYDALLAQVRVRTDVGLPCDEHEGLYGEFIDEIRQFVEGRITDINNSIITPAKQQAPIVQPPVAQPHTPPKETPASTSGDEPTDPLKFLLKHKALDRKRVIYHSKDGDVQGTVCGLIAPFIKITTDTGFVLNVPPKDLTEVK